MAMSKINLDIELQKFLEDTSWHTPPTEKELINAYLLGKKVVIDKLRERAILFGGDPVVGIRLEELDKL